MRIPSGVTDQYLYFVAVDSTDFTTRETGLSSFTVYRSRDGGAAAAMTTPTINETDATNMPGVYELLLDEDMTIGSGNDSEEMVFHITATGMAPVTRTIELYRPKITAGNTLVVESDGMGHADIKEWLGVAPLALSSQRVQTLVGAMGSGVLTATAIASNAITSAKIAASAIGATQIATGALTAAKFAAGAFDAVWTVTTRLLSAGTNIVLAKGTGITGFNDLSAAEVNTECDTALTDYDAPTKTEMDTAFTEIKGATWASGTDTLEAIRDRGDAAWTTGSGTGLTALASGTAQAGATGSITLAAGASATDDLFKHQTVKITSGTGAGQSRPITGYTGSTKVALVTPNWTTAPDATSVYEIVDGPVDLVAVSGAAVSSGTPDVNVTKVGGTTQTAGDLAALITTVDTVADSILVDTGTTLPATLTTIEGKIDTVDGVADAILVDTGTTLPATLTTIVADTNELQTDWADGGRLDLILDAILADTGTDGVVLSSATQQAIADALLDRADGVETSWTTREALRIILSAAAAKLSGAATATNTIRDVGDTKDRIVATVDADGNRTAITYDKS